MERFRFFGKGGSGTISVSDDDGNGGGDGGLDGGMWEDDRLRLRDDGGKVSVMVMKNFADPRLLMGTSQFHYESSQGRPNSAIQKDASRTTPQQNTSE